IPHPERQSIGSPRLRQQVAVLRRQRLRRVLKSFLWAGSTALASPASWRTGADHRNPWTDSATDGREPRLGDSKVTWRTVKARLRCLPTERDSVSAVHSAPW